MPLFKDISTSIIETLLNLRHEQRQVLFGEAARFERWLINENGVTDNDPISVFARCIQTNNNYAELVKSWDERIRIPPRDFERIVEKCAPDFEVDQNLDLAKKYLKNFVSCSPTPDHLNLKDDLTIITKNQSVTLKYNNEIVGAVIRDAALNNISVHFGTKMKLTTNAHHLIKRGESHPHDGTMVGHGSRKDPLGSFYGNYVYKDKTLTPESQKIYEEDGNTIAKWLYENARQHLPWAMCSYDEFKLQADVREEVIGALFCTKNYEAAGHRDKDRSEWAVGYVYEEGEVEEGFFFYPEYGVAIEMTSNSMWCWLTKAVHGTARLKLGNDANRYTAVITLTEKTARAIERKKGLHD